MRAVDWARASQAILFEAALVPAFVGSAAAVAAGARFDPEWFALILISLIGIQAGANLFKGFYEGGDRPVRPSSPGSWFAFDSGAAVGLTKDPRTVLRAGYLSFFTGVVAGLLLVVLTGNLLLLVFGLAGAVLAWSYSSPPFQLSYRGIGEIPTFLAFGPIMTVGATVAFGGSGSRESLFASLLLGFLAAAISFVRYFPNREEDLAKGKRTPVTILGVRKATWIFFGLLYAPFVVWIVWAFTDQILIAPLVLAAGVIAIGRALPDSTVPTRKYDRAIGLTIATHLCVGFALVADLLVL